MTSEFLVKVVLSRIKQAYLDINEDKDDPVTTPVSFFNLYLTNDMIIG
jgi:hypothetical protein